MAKNTEEIVMDGIDDENEKFLREYNATFGGDDNNIDGNHSTTTRDDNNNNVAAGDTTAIDVAAAADEDIFLVASKRQAKLVEERRIQRRKRLREIASTTIDDDDDDDMPSSISLPFITNKNDSSSQLQQTFVGTDDARQQPTKQNDNDDEDINNNDNDDDDDDEFDMFSSSVTPPNNPTITTAIEDTEHHHGSLPNHNVKNQQQQQQQQDWDDSEGYYKAVIGETIDLIVHSSGTDTISSSSSSLIRVRVAGMIGKGVFSTVLKCTVISNTTSIVLPVTVAMKCIRHNDSMAKTAITTELSILQKLHDSPGIVPLLLPTISTSSSSTTTTSPILEYRGHVLLVFHCMEYNLRDVLQKFGKGVGLSLPAVRSYFGQLLAALSHLQKFHIIHADIKPDNILVRSDFAVIQIADFGSAIDLQTPDTNTSITIPTPYLVSRFYRAPEIIMGLVPITHMIDLWSVAVTVGELYIGDVLFRGMSNNDMLYVFQQHLGPFTNRIIRQHIIQCNKYGGGTQQQLSPHFQLLAGTGNSYHFTQRTTDTVTGVPILKVLSLVVGDTTVSSNSSNATKFPLSTPLSNKLLKAKSAKDARKMVQQFIDLLYKCLTLDYSRRISLKDALRHEFFIVKTETTIGNATVK